MRLFYKLHKHKHVSIAPRTPPIFVCSDSAHSKHILKHFCFLVLMSMQIENKTHVRKPRNKVIYLSEFVNKPQNLSSSDSSLSL